MERHSAKYGTIKANTHWRLMTHIKTPAPIFFYVSLHTSSKLTFRCQKTTLPYLPTVDERGSSSSSLDFNVLATPPYLHYFSQL